jgi:hypothetical protein
MRRHPEQEAVDLPCHLSRAIILYLRRDIKSGKRDIPANIRLNTGSLISL